jgi:Zn-dependent peptidase ImmA (M78 family)/DNA-binding Xre family transcriptional regulator
MWRAVMDEFANVYPYKGDKLRLVRVARGYSLEELGNAIGVTRQNVHKMEAGQEPTEEQLPKLCEILSIHPNYFYAGRNAPLVEDQCHFRSLRSRTQTLTNTVMARAEILDAIIQEIEGYFTLTDFIMPDISDLNVLDLNDIEVAAKRLRVFWQLGDGPVDDITILIENAGVVIASVDGVDEKVDAFSMSRKRPVVIRNSSKKSPCRYRFDLAHELGHLLMHDGVVTGCKDTEKQANAFASAFLMPKVTFINAIRKYPVVKGVKSLNWTNIYKLKLYFKVSLKALLYRAKYLGLISDDQMRSGYIFLNKKGFSKDEPYDDQIAIEEPQLLAEMFAHMDNSSWQKTLLKLGLTQKFVQQLLPRVLLPKPILFSV